MSGKYPSNQNRRPNPNKRIRKLVAWGEVFLPWLLALAGVLLVLFNTRLGAYWGDDTYYYILPAREFMAGKGFHPSYIFGPVLPFLLCIIAIFKADPLISIRWLNAVLFGINLFILAHIIRKLTGSRHFALAGTALVLLSDVVIEMHGWAMSEALAITFMLVGFTATLAFIDSKRLRYAIIAAIATALAVLSRFAMLPLIPAISLTLLVCQPSRSALRRLRDAFLFGLACFLPLLLYWLRNLLVSDHLVRYERYIQTPFDKSQLVWFMYNWFSLFIPGRFLKGHEILAGILISLLIILLLLFTWRGVFSNKELLSPSMNKPGILLIGSMIVISLIMLYFARGFTELNIYNSRYLVPIFILFIIMVISVARSYWEVVKRPTRVAMLIFFSLFLIYYAYRTIDFTRQTSSVGLGYSNIGWHQSETVRYLQGHPELVEMVSTGEMGIYFWTGRMPTVLAAFPTAQALKDYLCNQDAPLFIMGQMPTDLYGMSHEAAVKDLELARRFNDGEMYVCPVNH
jgi:4-amino-4-deoxy-L-arabinose transferase-like glycosyltransferase